MATSIEKSGGKAVQLITDEYRKLNSELHRTNDKYGTVGKLYVSDVMNICKQFNTYDVLDYGCGKNTLANNLPFKIKKYDPAFIEYSDDPQPADIVVCTDVAEHIEPELLDNVLSHIASKTNIVCYMTCATGEASKNLPDGRNAHLIIQNSDWWKEKLEKFFHIEKSFVNELQAVFIMYPIRVTVEENCLC